MSNEAIYKGVILDHARHPRNRGTIENPDFEAAAYNPLCGDELLLQLRLKKDLIEDCRTTVRGCSVCQASASMMSEEVRGKSMGHASALSKVFQNGLLDQDSVDNGELENLLPLMNLRSHKSRLKCIALAWHAFDECAEKYHQPKTEPPTSS